MHEVATNRDILILMAFTAVIWIFGYRCGKQDRE